MTTARQGSNLGGDVLAIGLLAGGLYLATKSAGGLGIQVPSLIGFIEGRLAGVQYSTNRPAPGGQVTATVAVHNPGLSSRNYVVYGYQVPADWGQRTPPPNPTGHFWPGQAQGVTANTPYRGIPVTVPAGQTVQVETSTAPLHGTTTLSVLWQLWIAGGTAAIDSRIDHNVITLTG